MAVYAAAYGCSCVWLIYPWYEGLAKLNCATYELANAEP